MERSNWLYKFYLQIHKKKAAINKYKKIHDKETFTKNKIVKHILFPTKVNREKESDSYSTCSNPTSVVLVIVLGIIIGKSA
jgi:hypothetical protein